MYKLSIGFKDGSNINTLNVTEIKEHSYGLSYSFKDASTGEHKRTTIPWHAINMVVKSDYERQGFILKDPEKFLDVPGATNRTVCYEEEE